MIELAAANTHMVIVFLMKYKNFAVTRLECEIATIDSNCMEIHMIGYELLNLGLADERKIHYCRY